MTPDQVHYGQTDAVHAARQTTLDQAFRDNPARFVNQPRSRQPNQPPPGSIRQHRRTWPEC
jgi:putative transposase